MINQTDRIVLLQTDGLDNTIRTSISAVVAHLDTRYGNPPPGTRPDSPHSFRRIFGNPRNIGIAQFDDQFLQAALYFSSTNSRWDRASQFFEVLAQYGIRAQPPASVLQSFLQGVRLLLVELWNQQVVLLPTTFTVGTYFSPLPIKNELYEFVRSYEPANRADEVTPGGLSGVDSRRMYYYMPKILMAASWRIVEEVSVDELSVVHRLYCLNIAGKHSSPITTSQVPWTLFLAELLRAFPNRVSYNLEDLQRYSQWLHLGERASVPYSEFVLNTMSGETYRRRPNESNDSVVGAGDAQVFKFFPRFRAMNLGKAAHKADPAASAAPKDLSPHANALECFRDVNRMARDGIDWLDRPILYPGREHVSESLDASLWAAAFRAFLRHRQKVKGYESDKGVTSALNLLADYLFLYLPWWKELNPNSSVNPPRSPKEFSRYAFFHRSQEEPLSRYPMTFPELVKLRRLTRDTQYSVLKHIQLFFKFVEAHYSEDEEMAGEEFRSPVFQEFDMPRVSKPSKTTKVVFPKNSYGYLIYYGYAIEAFGQYLLERCVAGDIGTAVRRQLYTARFFDANALGFVPFVRFRGKITPVEMIPNVFNWATRKLKSATSSEVVEVNVPHLTTLRVLIAATELGLRLAGLRWLDRRTWDKDNSGCPDISNFSYQPVDRYVYSLYVNTDKTKDHPWNTNMVFRVRALLLREQQFQLSIDEPDMDKEVPYQSRPHSRFGSVLPLFRSSSGPYPISSNIYQAYWILYLIGFQDFYSGINGSFVQFVRLLGRTKGGEEPQEVSDENGIRYCPVSILAINTPHACRASFATNRQGIIETSDIAELLGHNDPLVTQYYQSPRAEDLKEKLELSDRVLHEDHRKFDKSDASYIRADKDDSSLVRSFLENRVETIARFGFMPRLSLWSIEESENFDENALEALRNGPMSQIRFRETHICPVGEECPADIVKLIGGAKRCGLCPLALKCIDHLPAIAAKKNALVERIKYLAQQKKRLEVQNEIAAVENLWEEIDLETNELLGWQLSEEILAKIYLERSEKDKENVIYHAERPDIVRRHLKRVVRSADQTEFLLHRIAESNAYPSLHSPQVQAVAANIRRQILAGRTVSGMQVDIPDVDDISVAASLIKTVMQANRLSMVDVSNRLQNDTVKLPTSILRIGRRT